MVLLSSVEFGREAEKPSDKGDPESSLGKNEDKENKPGIQTKEPEENLFCLSALYKPLCSWCGFLQMM